MMNLAVVIEKIPVVMGRTSTVFYAGLVGSWVGQVPLVLICTKFWRDDLVGLYTGVALGYLLLVLLLSVAIVLIDWDQVVEEARVRSEATTMNTALRQSENSSSRQTASSSDWP